MHQVFYTPRRRNLILALGPITFLLLTHWSSIAALQCLPGSMTGTLRSAIERMNPLAVMLFVAGDGHGSHFAMFVGLVGSVQWFLIGAATGGALFVCFRKPPIRGAICARCGYDLQGRAGKARCPECGDRSR